MSQVDVVVVGGGVIGLSCARSLKLAGVGSVVVLEREASCGSGSSSRANGGVRAQFTTAINIDFSLFSIGEFEHLALVHHDFDFHQTGYLLFTGEHSTAEGLRRAVELQRSRGVDTRWLEGAEVKKMAPLLRGEGLLAGTFHARDGFLDPWSVVEVMRTEAKLAGAELCTHTEVEEIQPTADGFKVRTRAAEFDASALVDAAGADAADIAALVGLEVPVEPIRRNLAYIEEERRDLIPMCVDLDTGVLIRREIEGGYVVAYSDPDDPPGREISVDPKFLEDVADRIGNRFPHLEALPLDTRHCWAGLYPETPDHHSIVSATPVEGFYLCAGFGGHGIMHAPAAGRAVAELVTTGTSTTFDLAPLRFDRFTEGDLVQEVIVL